MIMFTKSRTLPRQFLIFCFQVAESELARGAIFGGGDAEGHHAAAAAEANFLQVRSVKPGIAPPPFYNAKTWRKFIFTCSPGTGYT